MMRIAHLSFSGAFGGREKVAFSLAQALGAHAEVKLYLVLEERAGAERHERMTELLEHLNHYSVSTRKLVTRNFFSLTTLHGLADNIRRDGIQLLHCHCHKSLVYALLLKCSYCPSLSTTVTLHGLQIPLNLKYPLHHLMNTVGILCADGIIGCSREIVSGLSRFGFLRNKVTVIRNNLTGTARPSLNRDEIRKKFCRSHGISPDKTLLIGNASRLTAQKNLPLFLETIREIKDRLGREDLLFLLAGDGELKEQLLSQAAAFGLGDSVLFLGFLTRMDEFFCLLDLFLLTSDWEGTPMALLEAMSHGIPVVASDVGGVADVVLDGSTGLLFPRGDREACIRAVQKLLESPELRDAMGRAGRERIVEEFTEERWVREHLDHYRRLLRRKGDVPI